MTATGSSAAGAPASRELEADRAPPPDADSGAHKGEPERREGYLPIGAYAVIGDGHMTALVGRDGSIDWMCLPRIDAEPLLWALLDASRGGSFRLRPADPFESERRYLPGTNVLETTFRTQRGTIRLTDVVTLPPGRTRGWTELVRHVEALEGEVTIRWRLSPRLLPQGEPVPLERRGRAYAAAHRGMQLALRTWDAGETELSDGEASAEVVLRGGAEALLVLVGGRGPALPVPQRDRAVGRIGQTRELWRERARAHSYQGPWREHVERSLLAIGLLTDASTGAIAAAATTSLPERIGGSRNFDYRFGWVRDASFALEALLAVGVEEPTAAALDWLLGAVSRTAPRVDPVYTLHGGVVRSQSSLPLAGYRGSRPVHVGNDAGSQLQLGGFGDLVEAVHSFLSRGHVLVPGAGERLADIGRLVCALWRNRDSGLWELGERAHYTSSKLGCWVALQRLLELAEDGHVPDREHARWQSERDAIRSFIDETLFSPARSAYVMRDGSEDLDCAVLLAARRGYLPGGDERLHGTIDAIAGELDAGGPLLYRYSGMREQENAFLACSFWLVEALAIAGRTDEAARRMDALMEFASDVGLYSEELDPATGELRGNLPQALTHLALVNAAVILARCQSRA